MHIPKNSDLFSVSLWSRTSLQGATEQSKAKTTKAFQEPKDAVTISPLGKAKNYIDSLMKQKQKLTESKDALISATLEKGESMDSIKAQLESYKEQIQTIDEQVAQAMADQLKPKNDSQDNAENTKPKTEEAIQTERMNSMASLSSDLKQAQIVASTKANIDGESRVLKIEIKLDESRAGASEQKKERLANLQKQSGHLNRQIFKEISSISSEILDSSESTPVETDSVDTTVRVPETETDSEYGIIKDKRKTPKSAGTE